MKIAFYAPLKSPDHGVPSGDRQMARALIKALEFAGHVVSVVSQLRSFSRTPHNDELRQKAGRQAVELVSQWGDTPPDLWFTYHPYYKAPDFLALEILKTTNIPLVTAEASLAIKRDNDEWASSQNSVRELLSQSRANFYFTGRDVPGLLTQVPENKLTYLPPFIDVESDTPKNRPTDGPIQLITVAMMRAGVKIESYGMLAKALKRIGNEDWQLTIVGDGNQRLDVEAMFDSFQPGKIQWVGEVTPEMISPFLVKADVFVWPGFGEAYGLAYLEAQAEGLPVVAQNTHGVPYVVNNGETGCLVELGDEKAYAQAILELIKDTGLRLQFSNNAANFVRSERTLENASMILDKAINRIFS